MNSRKGGKRDALQLDGLPDVVPCWAFITRLVMH